jgi:hypothetical protein
MIAVVFAKAEVVLYIIVLFGLRGRWGVSLVVVVVGAREVRGLEGVRGKRRLQTCCYTRK